MSAASDFGSPQVASSKPKSYPIMSRHDVEALIANGRMIIIVNQDVLAIDAWVPYHPGGQKALEHMVGRDATAEVFVYVP